MSVLGLIKVYRLDDSNSFSWSVRLRTSSESRHMSTTIETEWSYKSAMTAETAARRWCKRLNVEIEV